MEPYKRIREIYGKAAIDYDKFWDFYSAPSYSKTLARINLEEGSKVLDLGCGTGELLKILEDCFPSSDLTGIDLTEEMLAIAKQKLSSRVELLLGTVTNLPFDSESFDWVIMSNTIGHLLDKKTALLEAYRVLKNPGRIVITDWTRDFQSMNLVHFYTKLINYSQYRSLKTVELESLLDECGFNHLYTERYKINWFWGLYTILSEKNKA